MAGYAIVPDIEAPELTGSDMAVWGALCRFAQWEMKDGKPVKSVDGSCYPSIQGIASKSKVGTSTVCRALNKLEKLGYIKRLQRKDKAFTNTEYMLFTDECRQGVVPQGDKGLSQDDITLSQNGTRVVPQWDKGYPTVIRGLSHSDKQTYPINIPINKPEEGSPSERVGNSTEQDMNAEKLLNSLKAKSKRKPNQRPLPNVPYDHNALGALTEMYELVPDYVADMPREIRFLQELAQEYPDADLFRQFRRARDWLSQCKKPKKDLLRFLRNWIAHGEKYGENKRDESDYEYTSVFVPVNDDT